MSAAPTDPRPHTETPVAMSSRPGRLSHGLRMAMLVIGTTGVGIASYLTYVHYSGIPPVCTAGESCVKVQTSVYSKLAGVPVALIGLLGYIAILASLIAPNGERSRLATAALTLTGFAFSGYLTYRELFSIHAICEWCATSAVLMTILMCLAVWRFLLGDTPPRGSETAPAANPEHHRVGLSASQP